jgi:hypothetical protein
VLAISGSQHLGFFADPARLDNLHTGGMSVLHFKAEVRKELRGLIRFGGNRIYPAEQRPQDTACGSQVGRQRGAVIGQHAYAATV